MTSGYDNQIIYVFQILLDSKTIYLSTDNIELTNNYDGEVIDFSQFNERISDGELSYSGGMSILGNMELILTGESNNSNFDSWFNEFFPNNSNYLINRFIKVGIVWDNATSDSQITWLSKLQIIDYSYSDARFNLSCDTSNEFTNINIPYYSVQDNYDDGISYIGFASADEKDLVIPTLYGDWSTTGIGDNSVIAKLAKCVLFNKALLKYKYAYHECHTDDVNNRLYKSVSGAKSFMIMEADTSVKVNNLTGSSIELNPITRVYGERILGSISLTNFISGSESDVIDFTKLNNYDSSDYIEIPVGKQASFKVDGNISTSETGMLNPLLNSSIQFQIYAKVALGTGGCDIYYWTDRGSSGTSSKSLTTTVTGYAFPFGISTSVKPDSNLPWTLEELCSIELVVDNTGSTVIQISRALLIIDDIVIQQYYSTYKGDKIKIKVKRG